MLVKVTQEHIDKAFKELKQNTRLRCECCPVAQALKDTFKVKYVLASYNDLSVGMFPDDNISFTTPTPYKVVDLMRNFDTEGFLEPFEFELSLEGVKL